MPTARTFLAHLTRFLARHILQGKFWRLRVVLLCLFLAAFTAPPHVATFFEYMKTPRLPDPPMVVSEKYDQWDGINIKIRHPMADMERYFPDHRQQAKRTFRITVPVIAWVLHLNLYGTLVLSVLAGPLLFFALVRVTERLTHHRLWALITGLTAAGLHAGHAWIGEFGGTFDSWGYALPILAMWTRSGWSTALVIVATCYCDERAVVASPAVLLFHLIERSGVKQLSLRSFFISPIIGVGLGWIVYITSRVALARYFQVPFINATGVNMITSGYTLGFFYLSFFSSWKAGILFVPGGIWELWRRGVNRFLLLLFVSGLGIISASALQAWDQTRGLSYAVGYFMVLLIAVMRAGTPHRELRNFLWPAALIGLLLPNFVLHAQLDYVQSWLVQLVALLKGVKEMLGH